MTALEFTISGDQVRRALADEATKALPDGELKNLIAWLVRTMDTEYTQDAMQLVVRYSKRDESAGPRARLA